MTQPNPHQNWRNVFLGRREELAWLEAAWKQTTSGEGPQMRVFTAESGYGKTKMAHAFYTRLSTAHDPAGYWPDNLLHEDKNLRVMPDMTGVNPGRKISWFWWGMRWENPDERNRAAIFSPFIASYEEPEFQWHQEALLAAVHARNATWRALFSAGKAALALFPGAGSVAEIASACSDMRDALGVYFDHAGHKKLAEAIAKSEEAKIEKLLTTFALLLDPKKGNKGSLPVVLLLDDAQWMDPLSLRIVQELWQLARKGSWPLMVLATHWQKEWNKGFVPAPGEASAGPPQTFARWVWRLQHPAAASGSSQCTVMSAGCIEIRQLGRLEEVRELLKRACPGLLPEQADFICEEAAGNPRHITEIVYKLEREPEWFVDEDCTKALKRNWREIVTPEQFKLATLQKERFAAIERPLKKMLGAASLQGNRFLQEFTLEVAEKCGFSTRSEPRDNAPAANPLHAAENPHAVAEALDQYSMEFCSNNIRKCAANYLEACEETEKVAEASADITRIWIQTGRLAHLPLELRLVLLRAAWNVAEKAANRLNQALFLSTALEQIERSGNHFYAKEWVALWERLKPTPEDLGSCDFWALYYTAYFLLEAGRECLAESLANNLEHHPAASGHREDINTRSACAAVNRLRGDLLLGAGKREAALERYLTSLVLSEQLREQFGDTPERLRDVWLSMNRVADVEHGLWQTQKALVRSVASLAICEQLREQFGDTPERLRDIANSLRRVADLEDEIGQTQKALERFMASLAMCEQLREQFGDTPERLRDIALTMGRIANVELKLGHTHKALERYLASLALSEQLRERSGDTPGRLSSMALTMGRIADVERGLGQTQKALERFMASLAICEQLREQFGDAPDHFHDIAVSLECVALVELELGQTQKALDRHLASLALREQLRERFGDTPGRLRDIASALDRVADVELDEFGQTQKALDRYLASLALREQLRERLGDTPGCLREVSLSLCRIADVEHGLGQTQKALERYMASLAMCEQLRERFGDTPERLRDIAFALDRIADVEHGLGQTQKALERFMASLAICEQLREQFGDTPERLRDVASSLRSVASVELELGQTQKALERHLASLAIFEQLREQFGDTPGRLHDVASSLRTVAAVEHGLGQTQKALDRYLASLVIYEQLCECFGDTPGRLRDIASALDRIADVELGLGQIQSASERYLASLALREQLREQLGDSPERLRDLFVSHGTLALTVSHSSGPGTTVAARRHAQQALALAEEIIDKYQETPDRIRDKEMAMNLLAGLEG